MGSLIDFRFVLYLECSEVYNLIKKLVFLLKDEYLGHNGPKNLSQRQG